LTKENTAFSTSLFKVVENEKTPALLPLWRDVLSSVGANYVQLGQQPEEARFPLPDPSIFSGSTDFFARAWLRIRDACLLRMQSPQFKRLSGRQWRSLLLFENVPANSAVQQSISQRKIMEQLEDLQRAVQGMGFGGSLSPSSLQGAAVQWYGVTYNSLPPMILRQVFWEVSEINFRYEIVALDLYYTGKYRRNIVLEHFRPWNRTLYVGRPDSWAQYFDGASVDDQWPAYSDLRWLMLQWPSAPHGLIPGAPLQPTEENERLVIAAYVKCFVQAFGRCPSVPRAVP
jgi:hypothetical protein